MRRIRAYLTIEPGRSVTFITSLILFKLFLQIHLYRQGFVSVSADEFARSIRAAKWGSSLHFDSLSELVYIWLPFEKYLNGLALRVWNDVILTPRITAFIASCVLLVSIFFLVKYLFASFSVAALASLFVVFQPWYIWLSGTPMLEIYFLPCFFIGFTFLLVWLKEQRPYYWIYGGLFFMFASGFHLQSWVLINVVNLTTVVFLLNFMYVKKWVQSSQLIGHYFLSNAFFVFFAIAEILVSGHLFGYLSQHTTYSRWFYQGYNVSLPAKLLYYPQILYHNFNLIAWFFTLIGIGFIFKEKNRGWKLYPLIIATISMMLFSMFNVFSGPPSAAPARYSLLYTLLLTPYVAYGVYRLIVWAGKGTAGIHPYFRMAPIAALFIAILLVGFIRTLDYPQGMSTDTIAVGRYMKEALANETGTQDEGTFMVELVYWDYLAIQLTSEKYDDVIFDRELDYYNRDLPSIFLENMELVRSDLEENNVKYVLIHNQMLKEKAYTVNFLKENKVFGEWTVFEFSVAQ